MYKCIKPNHYAQEGAWEDGNEPDERPVIVILDPRAVYKALQSKGVRFEPHPDRLKSRRKFLHESPTFELPEIRAGAHDEVLFKQGRHRTTILAEMNIAAYPVVTTDTDAAWLLSKFGASVKEARRVFDWSEIDDYPLVELM